ncbi:MAG TPA: hypothetical protein VES97_09630, partial [Solirubrobacteraceae bacterium]|nr:hypothetical protein [Solirubrobacteraceae bacterium]
MLRFLLWRLLGLLAALAGLALIAWFIGGGPGRLLRGHANAGAFRAVLAALPGIIGGQARALWGWSVLGSSPARLLLAAMAGLTVLVAIMRWQARRRRSYERLRVDAYRMDRASAEAVVTMFEALHKRLLRRWWRRLLLGQPAVALEVHHAGGSPHLVWLAV